MALKKKPTTGMKDILPREMEIRSYVTGLIERTYRGYGFSRMATPSVEHIENLSGGHGGENEKLIFKIMKRGAKLDAALKDTVDDLSDGGLRYDLTVPLVRYYANNQATLPSPFKALQMGDVWRADRPQKGRYRQFMQCDIDILGEKSILAETELILATSDLLGKLGFSHFIIRINDRRILKAMVSYSGFDKDKYDDVFIILDKLDKIGLDGVCEELRKEGYESEVIDRFKALLEVADKGDIKGLRALSDKLSASDGSKEPLEAEKTGEGKSLSGISISDISSELETIIDTVEGAKQADFSLRFDPTLVRGMSYYTGPIFEISMDEYGGSVGGGGRYDDMIGLFTGQDTPACGFSIGFERIVMLLLERDYQIPDTIDKKAFLIEKKCSAGTISDVIKKAAKLRSEGVIVSVNIMKKNKKFQKEQLSAEGYTDIEEIFAK